VCTFAHEHVRGRRKEIFTLDIIASEHEHVAQFTYTMLSVAWRCDKTLSI
jgi:hypothetical protein